MLTTSSPEEVELKFALPPAAIAGLEHLLARSRVLARRKATRTKLRNIYFDTPDQLLRRSKMALRVRHISTTHTSQWLQTFKVGGNQDAALSRRGEWETAVPEGKLVAAELQATPWSDFDPTGKIFAALEPVFTTAFDRTTWIVSKRDGSRVEVALDIGEVLVEGKTTPIFELEMELLAGDAAALFDIARALASSLSLLPLNVSKSERGYRLAQGTLFDARNAQPPVLSLDMPLHEVANCVMGEAFLQFSANLNTLRSSEDPEVLHQARVGWRRFKSALKLFKALPQVSHAPSRDALRPLFEALTRMRDLDVAAAETLPMLANAYTAGYPGRELHWHAMAQALDLARRDQRERLVAAIEEPVVGATLIEFNQWLDASAAQSSPDESNKKEVADVGDWAQQRASRLHDQLQAQALDSDDPEVQHRTRILSKRLRYCVEFLRPLLARRRAKKWYQLAVHLQTELGATRDILQALEIVAALQVDVGLLEFLRGFAAAQKMRRK